MKHEKEWYTCDRCGEEIKEDIYAWEHFESYFTVDKNLKIIKAEPYIEQCGTVQSLPQIEAITLVRGYHKKEKILHLCRKCRKDFERFMQNEKIK